MEDLLKLLALFKEPALMIAVLGLCALTWVNYQMFRTLARRDNVIESLASEVAAVNATISKMTTLVEVLVYGRRDGGHDVR